MRNSSASSDILTELREKQANPFTGMRDRMLANSRRRNENKLENCSQSQFSWARALTKDDGSRLLLVRKHKHLIKPYRNDHISKTRNLTHGTYTGLILVGCLYFGYCYGRL